MNRSTDSDIGALSSKQPRVVFSDSKYKLLANNKGQPTTRIIRISGIQPVYLFISQLGSITVFDTRLKCIRYNNCNLLDKSAELKDSLTPWINDVVLMDDCQKLAMVTTYSALLFYDISATMFLEEYRIEGLPSHPLCLGYYQRDETKPSDENSILIIGTETGDFILFYFSQPTHLLFKKQDQYEVEKINFKDLGEGDNLYRVSVMTNIHRGPVQRIHVENETKMIISCSLDSHCSLLISDVEHKLIKYQFKVIKGVSSFAYNRQLAVLVTAGPDQLIRVWNCFVTQRPVAVLRGHDVKIVDVQLFSKEKLIVSFSRDGVLIVWSLDDCILIQKLNLRFPTLNVLGRRPEFSSFPLAVDEERDVIFVTCSDWFARLMFVNAAKITNQDDDCESKIIVSRQDQLKDDDELRRELTRLLSSCEHTEDDVKITLAAKNASNADDSSSTDFAREKMQHKLFKKMGEDPSLVNRATMRRFVRDGGPHWTLKIHPIEEIVFPPLPMTTRMKEQNIVCRDEYDLLRMNFNEKHDQTATKSD